MHVKVPLQDRVIGSLAGMGGEVFKREWWRGWARSSEGYAVRIVGRYDLQYEDEFGLQHIFVEPMADWTDIVVDTSQVVATPERSHAEIVDRLRRAFAYCGWNFIE